MSGKKQHYIPQSLLRGFGSKKGKKTYVVAYTHDRGVFKPATDGIGAERHFYSELNVQDKSETLDDRITAYEQAFPELLSMLQSIEPGGLADSQLAAEFVTHLAVRNDHFRKSVETGGGTLFRGLADALTDESKAKAILGMRGDQPSDMFAEQMDKVWLEYQNIAQCLLRSVYRNLSSRRGYFNFLRETSRLCTKT